MSGLQLERTSADVDYLDKLFNGAHRNCCSIDGTGHGHLRLARGGVISRTHLLHGRTPKVKTCGVFMVLGSVFLRTVPKHSGFCGVVGRGKLVLGPRHEHRAAGSGRGCHGCGGLARNLIVAHPGRL